MKIHPVTFSFAVFWACLLVKCSNMIGLHNPICAGLVGIPIAVSYVAVHFALAGFLGSKERWIAVEDGE